MEWISRNRIRRWRITDSLFGIVAVAGLVGGFAVAGRLQSKATPHESSRITSEVYDSVSFTAGGDLWRFVVSERTNDLEVLPYELTVFRSGALVYRLVAGDGEWKGGLEVEWMLLPNGRLLVCALEFPAAGHAYARHFFLIRNQRLLRVVKVGGENGGPEFRDYDGDGKMEWVFDNFNWYEHYSDGPDRFQVFKETKSGKLRLWKSLPNPERRRLADPFEFHNL